MQENSSIRLFLHFGGTNPVLKNHLNSMSWSAGAGRGLAGLGE
jgi:hypothetical protein